MVGRASTGQVASQTAFGASLSHRIWCRRADLHNLRLANQFMGMMRAGAEDATSHPPLRRCTSRSWTGRQSEPLASSASVASVLWIPQSASMTRASVGDATTASFPSRRVEGPRASSNLIGRGLLVRTLKVYATSGRLTQSPTGDCVLNSPK